MKINRNRKVKNPPVQYPKSFNEGSGLEAKSILRLKQESECNTEPDLILIVRVLYV